MTSKTRYDVVMIGLEEALEAEDFGSRSRMMCKHLAESDRVADILVVYNPISIGRRFTYSRRKIPRLKDLYPLTGRRAWSSTVRLREKVVAQEHTTLLPSSIGVLSGLRNRSVAAAVRSEIAKRGLKDYILITCNPLAFDLARRLYPRYRVFDAIDNMLEHPDKKRFYSRIAEGYSWTDQHSDLICVASGKQREMFASNRNICLIPNGIDAAFFRDDPPCPDVLSDLDRPIVGYVGVLQDRFDVELMKLVIPALERCNFVFVGPVIERSLFADLRALHNVRFLGRKEYKAIPRYIRHFDVCIVPHKVNEFTDSMDPLKLYEYLACGKPVVSTPVSGTESFGEEIYLASDPRAFSESIERAMDEESEERRARRRKKARERSWTTAIDKLLNEIDRGVLSSAS